MTKWARLAIAALAFLGFFLIKYSSNINVTPTKSTRSLHHVRPRASYVTPNSIFVYTAYLDKRGGGSNKLRVLAINRCHKESEFILYARLDGKHHGMLSQSIEGACPWAWAKGCTLATYFHDLDVPENFTDSQVIIQGGYRYSVMNVTVVNDEDDSFLTVCVPPIYWYTDWTKLILFVEWWKSQSATKIIFYHQSSTVDIKTVLEFYVSQGVAEIIPWTLLPSSSTFNPNDEVYRLGHSLAMNDCILRAKSKLVALVDIDELIVPKSSSLSDLLAKKFNNTTVGSVQFSHRVLLYNPPLAPSPFNFASVHFTGVGNAIYKNIIGPPKTIIRRKAIDRMSTHTVKSFLNSQWTQKLTGKALLLHNRYNYIGVQTNGPEVPVNITDDFNSFRTKLITVRNKIFPNGGSFDPETQRALGACLGDWRKNQGNCKAPATACFDVMKDRENWVETTNASYYVV